MKGHLFAFSCPHCHSTCSTQGNLRQSLLECRTCGAVFRLDVAVLALEGPKVRDTPTDIVRRNRHAEGAQLIELMMAGKTRRDRDRPTDRKAAT